MDDGKIRINFEPSLALDYLYIFFSIAVISISIAADYIWPGTGWFGRSGALLVLFGALLEIRMFKHQAIYNKAFQKELIKQGIISPIQPGQLPGVFIYIRLYTHTQIILGTVVWGYGDLLIS
jgi:hypothetical protein